MNATMKMLEVDCAGRGRLKIEDAMVSTMVSLSERRDVSVAHAFRRSRLADHAEPTRQNTVAKKSGDGLDGHLSKIRHSHR